MIKLSREMFQMSLTKLKIQSKIEIDVIVGGPPCQGFSTANQQRIIDDPRNKLFTNIS